MRLFLYVFLSFVSLVGIAKGQVQGAGVSLSIDSSVSLMPGLNTVDLMLENTSNQDFKGKLLLLLPKGLRSVVGNEVAVQILAGKKRFMSLKLQSNALSALKGQTFSLQLLNADGRIISQPQVRMEVPEKRSVIIQDNTALQYFRQVGDSIYVKLRVINTGTTDEQINMLFSSPDRIGDRNFKSVPMDLASGQDSLIQFSFVVEKYMMSLAQYTVRVSGIYANSDVFGNTGILFANISSNRDYQKMFRYDNNNSVYSNNFIDLQLNNAFDDRSMYYLRSEGAYRLGDGQLRYGLNMNQFGDFQSKPNINSTFLEFEQGKFQTTLGNIQENVEAPIYGRGVKVAYRNEDKTSLLSTGFVEKTNDLMGFYSYRSPGYVAFSRLTLGDQMNGRKQYEGQFFFDKDLLDSTQSFLFANSFDLLPKAYSKDLQMTGFIGGGLYGAYGDATADIRYKPSGAFGLKINGKANQWAYSSDNFLSTAYYPGNRRGAMQFVQRVGRSIGKGYYSLGYFYSDFAPKYSHDRFMSFKNSTSRLDLNLNIPVSNFFNWNIQPSLNHERSTYWLRSEPTDLATKSWQLMNSLNLRSRNYKHNLFLTTEMGLVSLRDELQDEFVFKGNFSYNYTNFGLFGSYQKGAFQVFELINSELLGQPYGDRFTVGAAYSGVMLRKKLNWTANASTNLTNSFGNSYGGNLNINYRVLKNTMLTGSFQYNYTKALSGYDYTFTNMRIGVRQNLKGSNLERSTEKLGLLKVFCFYDNNSNGIFDAGDEVAKGYNFMVRNILFVTDNKGRSAFKKMPYGEYNLFFPMHKGYQSVTKVVQIHSATVQLEIPLQKVGTVQGQLFLDFDANLSEQADLSLEGYTIIAHDEQGRTFQVTSNVNGEFEFYLPRGNYSFYVDVTSFPVNISISDNQQQLEVLEGKKMSLSPFVLQVKQKSIEVKRFGAR